MVELVSKTRDIEYRLRTIYDNIIRLSITIELLLPYITDTTVREIIEVEVRQVTADISDEKKRPVEGNYF